MDESLLQKLSSKVDGRFKLTTMVQKRLVELMNERNDLIVKNCGGCPIRLVVEELARNLLELGPPAEPKLAEKGAGAAE